MTWNDGTLGCQSHVSCVYFGKGNTVREYIDAWTAEQLKIRKRITDRSVYALYYGRKLKNPDRN